MLLELRSFYAIHTIAGDVYCVQIERKDTTMTDKELIKHMALEYFGEWVSDLSNAPDFYDYLLKRGFKRQQLSRLGIGRDIQAGTAQQWQGDELE